MRKVAFFNNKGGVGKTSLVYHLSWMFADLGVSTLAVDLDPQANLTSMFLQESRLEELWSDSAQTIYHSVRPLMNRTGDIAPAHVEQIHPKLGLIPGDLSLSRFEDLLSENWPKALDADEAAFRILTSFSRIISKAAHSLDAKLVLIDVGPNLGAINRTAMIATDEVVIPLGPDLFSLQGLKNLGPTLREWRRGWQKRLDEAPSGFDEELPRGGMYPQGYVVMQYGIRDSRPVKAYRRWLERIPRVYQDSVLSQTSSEAPSVATDPHQLAMLKNYQSLMPLAMEAHKPMFFLKASDGAIGAHTEAVRSCYNDFRSLAGRIFPNIPTVGS